MNRISQLLASAAATITLTTGCATNPPEISPETRNAIEISRQSSGTVTKDGCTVVKAGDTDSTGAKIPPQTICPER